MLLTRVQCTALSLVVPCFISEILSLASFCGKLLCDGFASWCNLAAYYEVEGGQQILLHLQKHSIEHCKAASVSF